MEPGNYEGVMDYGEPIFRFQKSERPFRLSVKQDAAGSFSGRMWFDEEEEFEDEYKIPYNSMGVTISCSDTILVMLDNSAVLRILAEKLGEEGLPSYKLSIQFVAFEKEEKLRGGRSGKCFEGDWVIKESVKLLGFLPWVKKRRKGTWKLSRMDDAM